MRTCYVKELGRFACNTSAIYILAFDGRIFGNNNLETSIYRQIGNDNLVINKTGKIRPILILKVSLILYLNLNKNQHTLAYKLQVSPQVSCLPMRMFFFSKMSRNGYLLMDILDNNGSLLRQKVHHMFVSVYENIKTNRPVSDTDRSAAPKHFF